MIQDSRTQFYDCDLVPPFKSPLFHPFLLHNASENMYICDEINSFSFVVWGSPGSSDSNNLPAMLETQVQSLGLEDPLEEEMANHSSILSWRIPGTEEIGELHSMGSHRVRHD